MASHHAIAATSNAVRLLLENAAGSAPEWANAAFELYQADELQKPIDTGRPKVSVYLHRVLLSTARHDTGPRIEPDGRRYRPSIPLDLHYLVTAWSSDARTAQQLLGWTIRVLDDTPTIPTALLNTYEPGTEVFQPGEQVEFVWNPLSITDLNDIWQVASQHRAPSASYLARAVSLDSDVRVASGEPVRVRRFDHAVGPA